MKIKYSFIIYLLGGEIENAQHCDTVEILDTKLMDCWKEIHLKNFSSGSLINGMGILCFYNKDNKMNIILFGGADVEDKSKDQFMVIDSENFTISDFNKEEIRKDFNNVFSIKDSFNQSPLFLHINDNVFANIGSHSGEVHIINLNS